MRQLLFKWACRLPVTAGIPAREDLEGVKSGKQGERGLFQYYIDKPRGRGVVMCYKCKHGYDIRLSRGSIVPLLPD